MRGKTHSMDGVPDYTPSSFYVPGERHENLPVTSFAGLGAPRSARKGMGTPVQTLLPDTRGPEYATGGSGMFQGADFGHGKLIALHGPRGRAMGQSWDDIMSAIHSGSSAIQDVTQTVQQITGGGQAPQASAPAPVPQAAPVASPVSAAKGGFLSKKVMGVPVVAVIALGGVGAFFLVKALKKKK
jgi:hypothetical protein